MKKKIFKLGLNYHGHVSTNSFAYFKVFFLTLSMIKKIPPPTRGSNFLFYWGNVALIYTKVIHYLVIVINKCFKFQNDWLKIIHIRYNCTQFCRILLYLRNYNYRTTKERLERYPPKSNQHQIISRCN